MAYYRLYFMNPQGHFARFEEFNASDDANAIAHAEVAGTQPKELWCSSRRVERWCRFSPADNRDCQPPKEVESIDSDGHDSNMPVRTGPTWTFITPNWQRRRLGQRG